ncbi:hypothetical protein V3331_12675 [Gaopeijia maritima]|uniref:hypothetical protein n=1 Tax=Gaopeijia maritima TaxID=3119007 RepID=UPI003253EFE7
MPTPRLRPTFHIDLPRPPAETMEAFRRRLESDPGERHSRSMGFTADLFPEPHERRLWSPHLSIQARDDGRGGTRLHGRFAPFPEVWTFFVFVYGIAWFLFVFGAALGYAQWASGTRHWGVWLAGAGALTVAAIHLASVLGQRWGTDQMADMKGRFDRIVEEVASSTGAPTSTEP